MLIKESIEKDSIKLNENKTTLKNNTSTEKIIGINDNGTFKITVTTSELKEIFDNSLKQENITATLVNFEIKKDIVENSTQTYYYLLGSTVSGNVKIVTDLTLKTNNSFAAKMSLNLTRSFGSTCTCSGSCTQGCDPKHWQDSEGDINWKCSPCMQSKKSCSKSVASSN